MLTIEYSTQFKKDYKLAVKRGLDIRKLEKVITILAEEQRLDPSYHDHALIGNYVGYRECHIEPDWLLVYRIEKGKLTLLMHRTGTHSDLYKK